ncbi:MAG: ABC-2 family transporter protein [Defluviitaleaceae bacterium]|nr:ABC-2 family transporter protein [Defluviitaleaceae bacterium]MCL2262137.1 ABC-2 family transporter protein [Defluviitaleaceae bacterium]
MNALKTRLDICAAVALVTFKEWAAYRSHSMVSIFVGPVFFIAQYFIWTAVFASGAMPGMELEEVIRYFAAVALIGYLVMDFADWNLSMLVRTGKFLTFSLRPLNHSFFALSQKVGHRILGFLVEFLPCCLIFVFVFGIDMRPAYFGWLLLSVSLAFLMNFYVNYSIGLASFWIVQSGGIRSVYSLLGGIFSGALIPLVFFPVSLQRLQFFLPFQYTSFVPAMVFLGRYSLGGIELPIPVIVGVQAVAVAVVFIFAEILNSLAMKKFTAVGA